MFRKKNFFVVLLALIVASFFVIPVLASTTDGTIDSSNKYAWSSKAGWINFGSTNGNVRVTDSALTGYAWNDLYGWIHLNPTTAGVTNNAEGTLSGYAWSANLGWINFSGVTINSEGVFSGQATGDEVGVINFSCARCAVKTDWRPLSTRTVPVTTPAGGGGLPPEAYMPPTLPGSIIINNGARVTSTSTVSITLIGGNDITYAWVSEDSQFVTMASRLTFNPPATTTLTISFQLSEGFGQKIVYAKFCTRWNRCGNTISVSIIYSPAALPKIPPEAVPPKIPPEVPPAVTPPVIHKKLTLKQEVLTELQKIVKAITQHPLKIPSIPIAKYYERIQSLIPYLFKAPSLPKVPLETLVAKETPPTMRGKWNYVESKILQVFVFAPLPQEFVALANKFPQVGDTFKQVGINRFTDLSKLSSVRMYLPGLTQTVIASVVAASLPPSKVPALKGGLATTTIAAKPPLAPTAIKGGLAMEAAFYGALKKGIPIEQLSSNFKKKIPSDIIFARTAGQLVDFKVALSLTSKGRPEQRISTISGKLLHLTIRPDKPVKRVRGFIIFKSKNIQARLEMKLDDLVASLIFADPVFAYSQEQPVPMEEKLVLVEFEYKPDKDGIYTAEVQSPVPPGEYEIITVMDYEDPNLGSKQVRLIVVVDPEGYIYEQVGDKELRIPGAVVTLYYFNAETKRYEEWPAKDFQQDNPQITDIRGTYSFLVPGGTYYLKIEAPGYMSYEGKPFMIEEGGGAHMNIELKVKYWWLKIIDWKSGLLVLIVLALLYNFYKDRKRSAKEL